ncbi:hypothetical protein LXA43DRAFT_462988 [Ganoderma leucocontextum]|nr:hypothetical protein LXA43DRAFT_462988 [Ganoderma leucocontextum]
MDGLVSHPSSNPFALATDSHPCPPRPSSDVYSQKLPYPPSHYYDQSYIQQHPPFTPPQHSLQIHTANPAPHEQDPEEQTAHPSRPNSYHQLQHGPDSDHDSDQEPLHHEQSIADALTDNSGPHGGLTRALTLQERELLAHLDRLKFFLATAPSRWNSENGFNGPDPSTVPAGHPHSAHPALNRFLLPNSEYVTCVLWGGLYHITGTDIVRALVFRFEAFGRPVRNMKKFEEGVFSDLRNLKPGVDACLEEPKSPFLDLLFKYQCIRTQKKQKVFYWFSVPHDRLFLDALERDLKREKMGMEATTVITGEPALSFTYDPKRSLYEQFAKASGNREGEGELEAAVRRADEAADSESDRQSSSSSDAEHSASEAGDSQGETDGAKKANAKKPRSTTTHSPFFSMFSLFEGSPTYKQRRKKVPKARRSPPAVDHPYGSTMSVDADSAYGLYQQQQQQLQPQFKEPHLDRFGQETVRLSAEDMFRAQARGDFAGSNPDVLASQKERQRRALEALELASGSQGQGPPPPYMTGLSGPGVIPVPNPNGNGSAAFSAQQQYELSGYEPQAQAQVQVRPQQQQMPVPGGRPHLEQRHTYPIPEYVTQTQTQMASHPHPHPHAPMPVRSGTDPYGAVVGVPHPHPAHAQQPITTGWAGAEGAMLVNGALPRTKAFVCPLFSCGRMFKRMEHLKRHLRTHTLERPFQCERCKKRFSRSDNLAQHVRTHDRRAVAAATASGLVVEMQEVDGEVEVDELLEGEADVEDIECELDYLSGSRGITSVRMCEVEVQGQVHEVQGDEEGLVTTTGAIAPAVAETQEMFFDQIQQPQPHAQYESVLRASPEASPYMTATTSSNGSPDAQWAAIPSQQPSPTSAFAGSVMQQQQQQQQQQRLDASYHTLGDFVTSISAPSHKLTFDHAALYPAELSLNGPGPIRRHRSATPSIAKFGPGVAGVGEMIRRPYSAALSESGHGQRSYHPYAVPGHHHVTSHSAQSSPMAYTVPLGAGGYEGAAPPTSRHAHQTHSRSSSSGGLQEQMRQMLSLEQVQVQQQVEADMVYGSSHPQPQPQPQPQAQPQYQLYRTDSPMQYSTGVPGETYEMDVASQHQQQDMVQGMYVGGLADAQYAQVQAQQQAYFAHPHAHPHHSL